jgi:hypothetical protein
MFFSTAFDDSPFTVWDRLDIDISSPSIRPLIENDYKICDSPVLETPTLHQIIHLIETLGIEKYNRGKENIQNTKTNIKNLDNFLIGNEKHWIISMLTVGPMLIFASFWSEEKKKERLNMSFIKAVGLF